MVNTKRPYYPNLEAEIARNGVVKKDFAKKLGITERHFMDKLSGKTDFWWQEAEIIRKSFPDVPIYILLKHGDDNESEVR